MTLSLNYVAVAQCDWSREDGSGCTHTEKIQCDASLIDRLEFRLAALEEFAAKGWTFGLPTLCPYCAGRVADGRIPYNENNEEEDAGEIQ